MNEADLIATFHGYLAAIDTLFFGYVSVLSAFLIMSYLVADKLTAILTTIVLALFTAVCGVLITRLSFLRNDFESLYSYIIQQKASGNIDLSWFGMNPELGTQILTYLVFVVTVGGYLGCIAFFFFQRNAHSDDLSL
jgi:hypothetical protein